MGAFQRASGPKVGVRLARPEDAPAVVGLIRAIHPEVTPLLVYGCRGAVDLIRRRILVPAAACEWVYAVITDGRVIAGCAEVHRLPGTLRLTNIVVHPGFRSQGLGGELLASALRLAAWDGASSVETDVFEHNAKARAWYERLGFQTVFGNCFCEAQPQPFAGVEPALIAGLPRADIMHTQLGFSQFVLITAAGRHFTVGRLRTAWFRLTDEAALADPSVFAALALLPTRRYLAVVREAAVARVSLTPMFRRLRLRAALAAVLQALE